MPTYYLAVDIGASSGRHILGWVENGKIMLEEVFRFKNGMQYEDGRKFWDTDALRDNVIAGMKHCKKIGKIPSYMGIDTWGVDYVLVDKSGKRIDKALGYRDSSTALGREECEKIVSEEELYHRTGIQKLDYNTVYQLMRDKLMRPEALSCADKLLMMPDYLGFCLTGVAHQEYTNATTGALVNIKTGEFDTELTDKLGLPRHLFGKLSVPGETLGRLLPEIAAVVGYDLTVLHPASHDTGSAVLAVPSNSDDIAYLSSGTWSLLGIERCDADTSDASRGRSFTHEGGYGKSFRYLTNIMGLWIIQSIRHETGDKYSFGELSDMARAYPDSGLRININDNSLMSPVHMTDAVRTLMGKPCAELPEMLSAVYHSLADYYAMTVRGLSELSGRKISALHIIGGGSRDMYLNELTAATLGIPVYAGPTEATAIGNILCQMLSTGVYSSKEEARLAVFNSFDVIEI